ncbi:MAG: hypothetical protein ACAH59_06025 [Pseudobdellovibrionaceae bacterium]
MKQNLFSLWIAAGSLFLSSCGGPKDVDKIADAQACLDRATASEADECVSKVDGLESEGAYLIRCAGKFVKEGFNDPAKLTSVMSAIDSDTGTNGSTSLMAGLAFKAESSTSLNFDSANEAFNYCTTANSKGLITLSGFAKTSSYFAKISNDTDLSGAEIQALMAANANDPVAQEAVGTVVAAIYETNCTNDQSTMGAYCEQFESALENIPGGLENPTELGKQIMLCYSAPTTPGCSGF